ncbi:MAG: sensor histidine kinase [Cyclobacteriaceae bacterium]|nr:sensor histidine kinase [Cyclobacteriaceae bacterium]
MRFVFIAVSFLLAQVHGHCQILYSKGDPDLVYIEQLEREISETTWDSIKAYNSFKLSVRFMLLNDTIKAKKYFSNAMDLSDRNPFMKAVSYYYKARSMFVNDDRAAINRNLMICDSLLAVFEHTEAYKVRSNVWQNYAHLQQLIGNDSIAMNALLSKALPFAKKSGDLLVLGRVNRDIATFLMNADQRKKAQVYLNNTAILIENSEEDRGGIATELVLTYIMMAENYVNLNMYDSAKLQLDKAKPMLNEKTGAVTIHMDYRYAEGIYYDKIKQFAKALESFKKGLDFPGARQSPYFQNRLKYAKYKTLSNMKDYKTAVSVLLDLDSASLFDKDRKLFCQELYKTYFKMGNIREAYRWSMRYIEVSDSLYEKKYQNDVVEMEAKFQNSENQNRIFLLQVEKDKAVLTSANDRLLVWALAGVSLSLAIGFIFGFQYFTNSKKLSRERELNYQQQLKEVEQQRKMQFTQALLEGEEKERKRLAGDLHDGLGGMLAGVKINLSRLANSAEPTAMNIDLNKVIYQLDNSVNELRRIARNMMPQSLISLGLESALSDMCISLSSEMTLVEFESFEIAPSLSKETQVTIYRIVQELLTNAVRHAGASEIMLQCSQNESAFFITIEDNGRGFDTEAVNHTKGMGLQNVQTRIDYLNGKMVINSTPGNGTTINIELHVGA